MKNIEPAVVKTHLTKICLGVLVFALVGCGHSFMPAPTDSEVESTCYKSLVTITEVFSGQKIDNPSGQTISEDQAKAIMEVTGIERGISRVSGAKEIAQEIPDETDLFPIRVAITFKGASYQDGTKLPDTMKKLDFYFYKNDHNEWILAPENE